MNFIVNVWSSFTEVIVSTWNGMIGAVRQFTYKDAIDILLVSFIIYSVIKLVRETRAAQLIKGIIIIVLAFLVASQLELFMMTTLLNYFFQFSWIALLIVFQPELRNALEKVGRSKVGKKFRFSGIMSEKEDAFAQIRKCIKAVVTAVSVFQQDRTGALIVFERETKLGEVVDTGTILEAQPSEQMIGNIFFNKAPLHDGAMIVREGKIYAAGCILPLTSSDNISAELGTRHRAAIGISENSDAVAVIVSEETGQISVAVNGVLTRNYTRETLSGELERLMIVSPENRERKILPSKRRMQKK